MQHHGAGLRKLGVEPALVAQLKRDWRQAELNRADQAMLAYAHKLTLQPWAMAEADVVALRQAGFSDAGILDINQVTGYYAFANRLVDGLGVALESYWQESPGDL